MAKTAVINIRTEPNTKKEIEELFAALGLTVSEAVNVFFKKALMTQAIPFDMKLPKYNKETLDAMKETEDILNNPHKYKFYDNLDEFFKDLYDEVNEEEGDEEVNEV